MLGSLQAISHAPLLQLPVDEVNKDAGTNVRPQLGSVFAKESLRSLLNLTADCEYTLGDLALSSTNVWLNAFTLIACFPFLNMQGKSQKNLHVILVSSSRCNTHHLCHCHAYSSSSTVHCIPRNATICCWPCPRRIRCRRLPLQLNPWCGCRSSRSASCLHNSLF